MKIYIIFLMGLLFAVSAAFSQDDAVKKNHEDLKVAIQQENDSSRDGWNCCSRTHFRCYCMLRPEAI
jgi:hypothetical protein